MSETPNEDLIGFAEAARILETDESRVQVMVDEGLLHPLDDGDRLRRSEVVAARQVGG